MTKAVKATLVALVLSGASYGVYAACGDSECGWDGDEFACTVELNGGGSKRCSESAPCVIQC
ncbi:hypothetical protein ABMY35_03055 [Pseudoalteromonas sp. BZB3]|uniref:hypothetical protein n=1 Tax=Pseudoalteromonas sp. BZB3 TaxID=3136670 RepID=UPI0032C4A10F